MYLTSLLEFILKDDAINVVDWRGRERRIGPGEPVCTLHINHWRADCDLLTHPGLSVPVGFMEGMLSVSDGTVYDFFEAVSRNYNNLETHPLFRFLKLFDGATAGQRNPLLRARKNVAHHYDLSGELYDFMLDPDKQYSCAYFTDSDISLEEAQYAKKRHIASKLLLAPGQKVLDLGCGWGGMGLYLAGLEDIDLTGITLSTEQKTTAAERAAKAGLNNRVHFHLTDYRELDTRFDRVVSVGMFEHVGRQNYDEFFSKISELLEEDGVMLLHSIGRFTEPCPINPFIRKYIFPGADLPATSEVCAAAERAGLLITDIEVLRLHYAETLRAWRKRFYATKDRFRELYDERFCRMWELYLVICEVGFRNQSLMVFQMQIAKNMESVPLTRDYMFEWENAHVSDQRQSAAKTA